MQQTQENTQKSSIHPIIKKIFEKRNYSDKDIYNFFSNNLHELPDLTQLKDLELASKRIIKAIKEKEPIGIWGDYDVDGTTSCALLYHFFKMNEIEVKTFQPSRFIEGYGVHPSSIDQALSMNIKLLITVDCGISNVETADYALEKKLDLIITDHHKDARETMPKALAVINPNRRDETCDQSLKKLAGVGVAFALCLQIKNDLQKIGIETPSIYSLLQFVAIGTVCDMASLNPMNLKLVRHGLKQMPKTTYHGIAQFFSPEEKTFLKVDSDKLGFLIGPMINSKGRLDHPERSLKLMTSESDAEAFENFSHLEISNRERKFIQNDVYKSAKEKCVKNFESDDPVINIVYDKNWHEGVLGIVASKLVETFLIPAVVFTKGEEEGMIKASARSAGELNIFDCLKQCEEFYSRFGGHKAAAGLSMKEENFPLFCKKLKSIVKEIPLIGRIKNDEYDLYINASDVSKELIDQIEMLAPFGMDNRRPVFRMSDLKLESFKILKEAHVKWTFAAKNSSHKLSGISFNFLEKWSALDPDVIYTRSQTENLTIQFTLGLNRYNGNEFVQLMVDKVFFV